MNRWALVLLLLSSCASAPPPCPASPPPGPSAADLRAGVEAFNRSPTDATKRMDDAAILALWEEDGVTLLPATTPVVGKAAIAAFLREVDAQIPNAHMRSFEMHCTAIEAAGEIATEYCDEHQVVDLGGGRPPFDGTGKMLLVLHRGGDGTWRLRREMWNQGVAVEAAHP